MKTYHLGERFYYLGKWFTPRRQTGMSFVEASQHCAGPYMGEVKDGSYTGQFTRRGGYSWEDFYKASGGSEADIFSDDDWTFVIPASAALLVWED